MEFAVVEVDVEVGINDVIEGSLLKVAVESLWSKIVEEVFDGFAKSKYNVNPITIFKFCQFKHVILKKK